MSVTVKISRPIEQAGKSTDTIVFNLEGLTGDDVLLAERDAVMTTAMPVLQMRTSGPLQLQLAARASGIAYPALSALPAKDCIAIIEAVQGFLFAPG